jgi:hypothetical protein
MGYLELIKKLCGCSKLSTLMVPDLRATNICTQGVQKELTVDTTCWTVEPVGYGEAGVHLAAVHDAGRRVVRRQRGRDGPGHGAAGGDELPPDHVVLGVVADLVLVGLLLLMGAVPRPGRRFEAVVVARAWQGSWNVLTKLTNDKKKNAAVQSLILSYKS